MIIHRRDDERARQAMENLAKNDGYCPCKLEHKQANRCMCREFNLKCMDKSYHGVCDCGLYEKMEEECKELLDDAGKII